MTTVGRVRVGEVLRLERREVKVDVSAEYEEIGIRSFGRGIFHKEPVDGAMLGDKRVFHIEPGDLVISNVFAWEGAITVATNKEAGKIGSHRFMTFVARDGRIDARWAAWYFRSEPGLEQIRQASPGSAGRNKTLAVKRFEDLIIPLPAIDEQERVAARLDQAQAATDRISELAGGSDALSGAFAAACASAPHLNAGKKLARGWSRAQLGEVLTRSHEQVTVDLSGSYPNLGIYSFGRGLFEKSPIEGGATSARTLFRVAAGQFVSSRLFAFEGAYATVPEKFNRYFVSNEFPSFDADPDRLDAAWLASYMRSPDRWADLAVTSIGLGVRRQRVPVESVLAHEVLLPPIEEQRAMVRSIQRVEAIRALRKASATHIAATVPSLLNQEFGALA